MEHGAITMYMTYVACIYFILIFKHLTPVCLIECGDVSATDWCFNLLFFLFSFWRPHCYRYKIWLLDFTNYFCNKYFFWLSTSIGMQWSNESMNSTTTLQRKSTFAVHCHVKSLFTFVNIITFTHLFLTAVVEKNNLNDTIFMA